jgi:predicted nucleic acid-binding Zn ribbon protein
MKTLICPHCGTQVPAHVSVCVGCGAEIVRGATRQERSTAGCVVALLALFVAMIVAGMGSLPDPQSDAALFLIFKFIAVLLVGNAVGRIAMSFLRRSKLRFLRSYKHN